MTKFTLLFCASSLLGGTDCFAPSNTQTTIRSTIELSMSNTDADANSRRSFLSKVVGSAALGGFSLVTQPSVQPANALGFGGGLSKVNAKLQAYGVPQMDKLADGFSPLLEVYGKGKNRDPLLVQFVHPSDWVVTLPSQDTNGEDGTIQAGQYAKGDTATFFLDDSDGKVDNISEQSKEFFQKELIKAISQKGDNVYQNFKVTNMAPQDNNGQGYVIVDFKYDLLTGAGFEVERRGVASVTSTGKSVQVLWAASTRQRYNKSTEGSLREIASSFRVYSDGLDSQKIVYKEDEY